MFKIAKSFDTINEQVGIKPVDVQVGYYDKVAKKQVYHQRKELEISISGSVGNEEYCLHFIISKPVEDYFKIKKYDKIIINENEIIDNYIEINGLADMGIIINLEVLKFSETLIFNLIFKTGDNDFFGTAEVEVLLDKLKGKQQMINNFGKR